MGRAVIAGGGTDGRYTITVDYGTAQKEALLAALNQLVVRYDAEINKQIATMATLLAREAELKEQLRIVGTGLIPPPYAEAGNPISDTLKATILTIAKKDLERVQDALRPMQLNGDKMRYERANTLTKIATLNTAVSSITKQAWCTTFTEDGAGPVATIDINGESDLTLIAPDARAWAPSDGLMTMPHIMSPEQSFLNLAILPGWQKHMPTYRWGTLTGINYDNDTADVSLAPATSSAQRLDINKFTQLSRIPVSYMSCNAKAFEIGDRVVVQFIRSALAGEYDAKVIGFLDNPKPCEKYTAYLTYEGTKGPEPGFQERYRGQTWAPITADASPHALIAFMGWSDGVGTAARNDGKAIANLYAHPVYLNASGTAWPGHDMRLISPRTRTIYIVQTTLTSMSATHGAQGWGATATMSYTVTRTDTAWPAIPGGSVTADSTGANWVFQTGAEGSAIFNAEGQIAAQVNAQEPATRTIDERLASTTPVIHVVWSRSAPRVYTVTALTT